MGMFSALDVSQEETAICVVRQDGTQVAEAKVPTYPDAIADWLTERTKRLERSAWRRARWPSGFGMR
jgi:transposase